MATTPESFVDALNAAFGGQTTQRSVHAKSVVLLGKFVPSAEAVSVSKALHFKREVPVTARFAAEACLRESTAYWWQWAHTGPPPEKCVASVTPMPRWCPLSGNYRSL